jgi:hypothetical protein
MNTNKQIEVGLYDRNTGDITQVVSLDDLIATGDSYELSLRNFSNLGSNDYELVVENEPQIAEKVRLGHLARQKISKQRKQEGE